MRSKTEVTFPGHYVFLCSDKKDDKDHLHKLAPNVNGPFLVNSINTDPKTLFIVRKNKTVGNVYRLRVVHARSGLTSKKHVR